MAHYAKVWRVKHKVAEVIVADEDFIATQQDDPNYYYVKTDRNTRHGVHYDGYDDNNLPRVSDDQSQALRYNFAGAGYTYDPDADAFIPPKPHDSWVMDDTIKDWVPPIAYPADFEDADSMWDWDEAQYESEGNGWVDRSA